MRSCILQIAMAITCSSMLLLQPTFSKAEESKVDPKSFQETYHYIRSFVSFYYPASKLDNVRTAWNAYEHKFDGKLKSFDDLQSAVQAMMSTLDDPDARMLTREEAFISEARDTSGRIDCGLSFDSIQLIGTGLRITKVHRLSTAEKAGLLVNDIIVAVDGTDLHNWVPYDAASRLLAGEVDSEAKLTILRNNKKMDFTVIRDTEGNMGIEMQVKDMRSLFKVSKAIAGYPAALAGVERSDIITAVNGYSVNGISHDKLLELLSTGYPGTNLSVDLLHNHEPATRTIKLKLTTDPSCSLRIGSMETGFGASRNEGMTHIVLTNLNWGYMAYEADRNIIEKINRYPNAILDLRGCSGGDHLTAAEFAALFIKDGWVMQCSWQVGNEVITDTYKMVNGTLWHEFVSNDKSFVGAVDKNFFAPKHQSLSTKLVVLVDDKTSGAAEALAYALQRNNRATVLGFTSAGQSVLPHTRDFAIDDTLPEIYIQIPCITLLDESGQPLGAVHSDRRVIIRSELFTCAVNELNGESYYNNLNVFGPAGMATFLLVITAYFAWRFRKHKIAPITSMTYPPTSDGPRS